MKALLARIRARWDIAVKLVRTERSLKYALEGELRYLEKVGELTGQVNFLQTQLAFKENEMRLMLSHANTILMECPKGPISMAEVLRFRADWRAFRKAHPGTPE